MKVALVTGASKGIGRAIAKGLGEDGFNLALTARSEDQLNKLKEELSENGTGGNINIETYPLDVRDHEGIKSMVDDTVAKFGRIDLLFNNAGVFHQGTVDLSYEEFSDMIDINLKSAFYVLQQVVPVMRKQKSGTIINLSSRSGLQAKARSGGYAASKFALVGLNEALYRDATADGIKVTALCPGWVDTSMSSASGLEDSEKIQTDDIVETVRWLLKLSPSACVKDLMIESIKQVQ